MKTFGLHLLYILFIFCSMAIASCNSSLFCDSETTNSGDIILSYDTRCLPSSEAKNFVIRSQEELILSFDLEAGNCDSADLTPIDFNEFTLLGAYTTGGCKGDIERNVIIDSNSEYVKYSISHESCGRCKEMNVSYNWVLVEAIPENFRVEFDLD